MGLIEELRAEHKQIVAIFDELDKESGSDRIKQLTASLSDIIVAHVQKENARLYPALERSASEEVRQTAKIFSGIMVKYSVDILNIIKTVVSFPGQLSQDVLGQYLKVRGKIRDRVRVEETILFPAYREA